MSIETRIRAAFDDIKSPMCDPMPHAMPNRLAGWETKLGDLPIWSEAVGVLQQANLLGLDGSFSITRQQMFDWVTAGVVPFKLRFVLTLLWGYGPGKGRGRSAVSRILRSEALDETLKAADKRLKAKDTRGAFDLLSTIGSLGISFSSKFLYFETRAWDQTATGCSLIFDNRVSKNLVKLSMNQKNWWVLDLVDVMRRDKWSAYMLYCQSIRTLAADFGLEPDRLELWLYLTADDPGEDSPE